MIQKTGFIPSFMEIYFVETFTKFHCDKPHEREFNCLSKIQWKHLTYQYFLILPTIFGPGDWNSFAQTVMKNQRQNPVSLKKKTHSTTVYYTFHVYWHLKKNRSNILSPNKYCVSLEFTAWYFETLSIRFYILNHRIVFCCSFRPVRSKNLQNKVVLLHMYMAM